MFKCSKCSNYVNEKDLFCRNCGQKLEGSKLLEIEISQINPVIQVDEEKELSLDKTQNKETKSLCKSHLNVMVLWVAAMIIFVLSSCGAKAILRSYDDVNQIDLSIFAHQGKWTYFSHARLDSSLQKVSGAMYKFNENNPVPEKFSDGAGGAVKVKDGWLYYLDITDNRSIYKIKTDGTEKTKLTDAETGVFYLKVYGNYLYYKDSFDSSSLIRMKLDGSFKETVSKDAQSYYLQRDKIYYLSGTELGALYEMKLDGSGKRKLGGVEGPVLYIDDNYVYYLQTDVNLLKNTGLSQTQQFCFGNTGKLYRMRKDGAEKQLIMDDNITNIYIRGNHIYYMTQTLAENSDTYRTDMEGKNKTKLPIEGYFMGIADKWIYYVDTKESQIYRTTIDYKKTQKIQTDLFKPQW